MKTTILLLLTLAALLIGCATTPEQRQADEQRKVTDEQRKLSEEQGNWQKKLAPYSDDQLRFKYKSVEQELNNISLAIGTMFRQGNGLGVLIAKGGYESKLKERDAIAMEIIRRGNASEVTPPQTGGNKETIGKSGTGFFITADGYFVTCQHVVDKGSQILIQTKSGTYPAKVIREDKGNDIAILKAEGTFSAMPIIGSRAVQLGEAVFTIGFPNTGLQGVEPKLTRGDISSLAGFRDDPRRFQISVAVQPGNSGGPLLNQSGNVVGVIVAGLDDVITLRLSGSLPQNVNYAVKSSLVNTVLESLPDVSGKLKEPYPETGRDFKAVVDDTRSAVGIVLVH
jgi:S1-C subfamily serine protease